MKKPLFIITIALFIAGVISGGGVFASIFFGSNGGAVNLQKGLVGNWDMNGNAKDKTMYANNGTLNGDAAVTATDRKGQSNKAATFDGTGDYVSISASDSFEIKDVSAKPFTVSAWIKPAVFPGSGAAVLAIGTTDYNATTVGINNTGRLSITADTDGVGGWEINTPSTSSVTVGVWSYITFKRDTSGNYTFYINGVDAGGGFTNANDLYLNNNSAKIAGHYALTAGYSFNGQIDDVRVYNRALSTTEITALYELYDPNVQISSMNTGLVGHWNLNGNARDVTPNSNNGTVGGSAPSAADHKGQSGKAYSFTSASSQFISLSGTILNITSQVSVAMWIKATDSAGSGIAVIKNSSDSGNGDYWLTLLGGSEIQCSAAGGSGSVPTGITAVQDTWYHIAITYKVNELKCYVNGTAQGATDTAVIAPQGTTNLINLGRYTFGASTNYWDGSIDDFRVYNRILTAPEVLALYESYDPSIQISTTEKGLVGYWDFNGNAKDKTPYGNNGTVAGAVLANDRKCGSCSNAYSFNGTTDYLSVADTGSLPTVADGSFSISAWAKITNESVTRNIVRRDNAGDQGAENRRVVSLAVLITSGYAQFGFYNGTSYTAIGTIDRADGNWHYFVGAYDAVGKNIYLYVDGGLEASNLGVNPIASFNTARKPWTIGAISPTYGPGETMLGSIDDVRIYNRVITAEEVLELYQSY